MNIPIIDPEVKFMGVSSLRTLNSKALKELRGAIVLQENINPLAIIIPYKTFIEMQEIIKKAEEE